MEAFWWRKDVCKRPFLCFISKTQALTCRTLTFRQLLSQVSFMQCHLVNAFSMTSQNKKPNKMCLIRNLLFRNPIMPLFCRCDNKQSYSKNKCQSCVSNVCVYAIKIKFTGSICHEHSCKNTRGWCHTSGIMFVCFRNAWNKWNLIIGGKQKVREWQKFWLWLLEFFSV